MRCTGDDVVEVDASILITCERNTFIWIQFLIIH